MGNAQGNTYVLRGQRGYFRAEVSESCGFGVGIIGVSRGVSCTSGKCVFRRGNSTFWVVETTQGIICVLRGQRGCFDAEVSKRRHFGMGIIGVSRCVFRTSEKYVFLRGNAAFWLVGNAEGIACVLRGQRGYFRAEVLKSYGFGVGIIGVPRGAFRTSEK